MATLHETRQATARRIAGARLPCYAFDSHADLARHAAQLVAGIIRERNAVGQRSVLGLPTGSTPVGVYRELIRLHCEANLDFSRVVTFNLDEYYGLAPDRLQSYHRWMHETFFDHVNIRKENIHLLEGTTPPGNVDEHCRKYEDAIRRAGGIDIQLLGIGRNGHVAFNEPSSERDSRTRLVRLDPMTRAAATSDFFTKENVPAQALTMGLGTILEARKLVLIALGEHKSWIVRDAAEGPVTDRVPASFLQEHPDATFLLDSGSSAELTGVATPWVLGNITWNDSLIKRATLWLAEQAGKALLKLDDHDFRDHNLHKVLRHHGPAPELSHRVFRWMMETIEYHPGGRKPQKVVCFSPHPDDDVISMGGTLIRLVEDGHDMHVAYMTSGNIAVFDHDAERMADLLAEFSRLFDIDREKSSDVESHVRHALAAKEPGDLDTPTVLRIKSLIRWSEAKAGAAVCGIDESRLRFLDLPFYQTGTIEKRPIGDEDVRIVRELIERIEPGQIYLAGDLTDPHGTHRMCAEAVFRALDEIVSEGGAKPDVFLYRGAWQEWPLYQIDLAVPLSPSDVARKKDAIFRHESQKDSALFPGPDDPREFWQRAVDRNCHTADLYNRIGLPEYYAMEGFVRWQGQTL